MRSRWKLLAVWGVLLILAVGPGGTISLAQEGPECTITVQPGESIQTAIDRAPEGAVVCLEEREWQENISIEKSLTLRGQGAQRSVIRAKAEDIPVVRIRSDEEIQVHIEKLTVTGARWDYGILVEGSAQATITGSTVSGNGWNGIKLRGSAQATITECTISENGYGIWLSDLTQATISENTISGNKGDAIELKDSAQATISGSVIERNSHYGILSDSTGEVCGEGNEMRDNGVDLGGNLPGSLRLPLVEPSEEEIIYPAPRYPTLQHAVDALLPGGKLILQGGEYEAGLTITKELTIAAQEGAEVTLRVPSKDAAVLSLVGGAKLSATGLKVTGGQHGFLLAADAQATITESTVSENDYGFRLLDSAQATITGSTISGNVRDGISLEDSTQATITGSTISGNICGIVVSDSAQATITGSTVSENWGTGIGLGGSAQVTISESTISRNVGNGIELKGSAQATIAESTISRNVGNGIGLTDLAQATINRNAIEGNSRYGIFSKSTDETRGEGNEMRDNGVDLAGNLPASLRLPLVEPSEEEIIYPDARYATLQHAVDALLPGGKLILWGGEYQASLTITKELTIAAQEGAEVTLRARDKYALVFSLVGGAKLSATRLKVTGGDGFLLGAHAQVTITGCAIFENRSDGIELWNSTQATISGSTISRNMRDGIWLGGSAQTIITESTVSGNRWDGIDLLDSAQATMTGSTISENMYDGIWLEESAEATIEGNKIFGNRRYGVALVERPCSDTNRVFTGYVTGKGNTIPGPGELNGNEEGAVCPDELSFLTTEEGSELDRRPQAE